MNVESSEFKAVREALFRTVGQPLLQSAIDGRASKFLAELDAQGFRLEGVPVAQSSDNMNTSAAEHLDHQHLPKGSPPTTDNMNTSAKAEVPTGLPGKKA